MSTWQKMQSLISKARQNGYKEMFPAFKSGEKVGHNSHYRFIFTKAFLQGLYGGKWQEESHKILDICLEQGGNPAIEYMYETAIIGENND